MRKSFENGLKSIPYSGGNTCLVSWLHLTQYVLRQPKKYGISFIKGRESRSHRIPWSTCGEFFWVSGSNFSFSVNFRCLGSFHLVMIMDFSGQLGVTISEVVIWMPLVLKKKNVTVIWSVLTESETWLLTLSVQFGVGLFVCLFF